MVRAFIHGTKLKFWLIARALGPARHFDAVERMLRLIVRMPIANATGAENERRLYVQSDRDVRGAGIVGERPLPS